MRRGPSETGGPKGKSPIALGQRGGVSEVLRYCLLSDLLGVGKAEFPERETRTKEEKVR